MMNGVTWRTLQASPSPSLKGGQWRTFSGLAVNVNVTTMIDREEGFCNLDRLSQICSCSEDHSVQNTSTKISIYNQLEPGSSGLIFDIWPSKQSRRSWQSWQSSSSCQSWLSWQSWNLDNLVNLVNLDNLDNVCNFDDLGNLDKIWQSWQTWQSWQIWQ